MQLKSLFVVVAMLAGTSAAMANCYEGLGCDNSEYFSTRTLHQATCEQLWEVRNFIYQQNGYCFQSERAIQTFGNKGCTITNASAVKLNIFERKNIETIATVEKAKGCN